MSVTLDHLLERFDRWLRDPAVEDICVNGPDNIWIYRRGAYERQEIHLDATDIEDIAVVAAAQRRQDIHHNQPILSTDLAGRGRLQAIVYPCVPEGSPCLVIRRGSDAWPTISSLAANGLFLDTKRERVAPDDEDLLALYREQRWEEFFTLATMKGKTILACGVTGSGKTHFSKACLAGIPSSERLVTIEDAPELIGLNHSHPNSVQLYYDKSGKGIKAAELVETCLRMRPDRIVLQEIRDGQAALAFILAIQTGHKGITTIHADNCAAAFDRLRFVIKQDPAGAAISDTDLTTQLRSLVDIVVHLKRYGGGFSLDEVLFSSASVN